MLNKLVLLAVLVIPVPLIRAQGGGETPPANGDGTRQIVSAIDAISNAYAARNSLPFERFYADGYVYVRTRPVFNTKQQLIAMLKHDARAIKAGRRLDFETLDFSTESPSVRFVGDTAIVTLVKKHKWAYRGIECLTKYVATDVWTRDSGQLKIVAGAANAIQCSPLPWNPPHPAVAAIGDRTEPDTGPDTASQSAIDKLISEIAQSDPGTPNAELSAKYFTDDFIGTDSEGNAAPEPSFVADILRTASDPRQKQSIDEENFSSFGNTVIYTFRTIKRGARGFIERSATVQHMVVLVRAGEGWRIAAWHGVKAVE